MSQELYEDALACFENAKCCHLISICKAYLLRAEARDMPLGPRNTSSRNTAFANAAEAFLGCVESAPKKGKPTAAVVVSAISSVPAPLASQKVLIQPTVSGTRISA